MSEAERVTGPAERVTGRGITTFTDVFLQVEHGVYIALGAVLAAAAVLALVSAVFLLASGAGDWRGLPTILPVIDRLLLVLMLTEILHTVRVSIRSGALTCEPFLIVGLIASIRRILVITLKSSEATQNNAPDAAATLFHSSMVELGVLAGLILVMVISIAVLRRQSAMGHEVKSE